MIGEQGGSIAVDGLVNLRDLGGLPVAGGGVTRQRRLLRSESLHALTATGRDSVLALGVRTIVDLRTVSEREAYPSLVAAADGVSTAHTPIFNDGDDFPAGLATAEDVYGWWLRERGHGIAAAMSAIADSVQAPILVHCHAGKDRTGVVVALVLMLAGVSVDAIADDYALSGERLGPMLARDRLAALERGMDAVRAERLFTVRREAMVRTVDRVRAEHGGSAELLSRLGVDPGRIDRLRRLMIAPAWP